MEPETTATQPASDPARTPATATTTTTPAAHAPMPGTGGPPPGIDPTPTPIAWHNLHRWALLTYKAERRYYRRLGRS
jgi:hypothetical protein